ncbi:hypothetical protein AB0B94_05500, partial [Micromonospora sp. NPDC048986]|uniref:hypothetical protein n=1 Tax=Micromonospora sp. NPDC048986 TaxID=3155644 RepID=UPI0034015A56
TLWVLPSTGSAFTAPQAWWRSSPGNWSWSSSKVVAGNFTNDDIADVAIMYDYGGSTTTLWVLSSTGSAFTAPQAWWRSNTGNWSWTSSKITVGNYTAGDTTTDVAIMYDYGGSTTTLWVLPSTGSAFTAPETWWRSNTGSWSWSSSKTT